MITAHRRFGAAELNVVIRATKIQMARREFQNEQEGKERKRERERRRGGSGGGGSIIMTWSGASQPSQAS